MVSCQPIKKLRTLISFPISTLKAVHYIQLNYLYDMYVIPAIVMHISTSVNKLLLLPINQQGINIISFPDFYTQIFSNRLHRLKTKINRNENEVDLRVTR